MFDLPVRRVWLIPAFGLSQYQRLLPSPNYQLQLFAPTTRTDVELRFLAENFSRDQKKQAASPVDLNRLSPGLLHAFLVVAEVGKISEAARQLHLSQPGRHCPNPAIGG
jgi:hypothetical protein